ncbi:twitching motility protein PilT [candidate division WOR-3 bacterium]|nr:twitching motility protein PilT [candidate division WOR-3 bacterium]
MPAVKILFHGCLNDFLPEALKLNYITIELRTSSSVKDVMESQGIPHPEAGQILVNGLLVSFDYRVGNDDRIEVFPLKQDMKESPKFVLDVHLGALTRKLRLLGFDSKYRNDFEDSQIAEISYIEDRTVLTRDIKLLMRNKVAKGRWLRSKNTDEQLDEVWEIFNLKANMKPFSLCMNCNGKLIPTEKKIISSFLLPGTAKEFNEFYQCKDCKKIYWRGSHYPKLVEIIERYSGDHFNKQS